MLMNLIGATVAYGAVKGTCNAMERYGKNANPRLNNREFDLNNSCDGIKIKGEKNIMNIAARCGIRTKDGVLPKYGYKQCLNYVRKYIDHPSDEVTFKREWKKVSDCQEKRKSYKIKKAASEPYESNVNAWKKEKWTNMTIILEFDHWYYLTLDEHRERAMDIYDNTYFGEIAVKPPVVRKHPKIYGKRTEVWKVKAIKGAKQDSWSTNSGYKALYNVCCKHRGYEPK